MTEKLYCELNTKKAVNQKLIYSYYTTKLVHSKSLTKKKTRKVN
jgi:hypothetical protein